MAIVSKLLWKKRNKTLQNMLSLENYLTGYSNSSSCQATLHHSFVYNFSLNPQSVYSMLFRITAILLVPLSNIIS